MEANKQILPYLSCKHARTSEKSKHNWIQAFISAKRSNWP